MFRAFHNELPRNLQNNVNRMCLYMVLDRTIHSFCITRFRTNTQSMCISIYGARLWNSLNENSTTCRTIKAFKKCYKLDIVATY